MSTEQTRKSNGEKVVIALVLATLAFALLLILRTEVQMAPNSGAREVLSGKLRAISAKLLDETGTISVKANKLAAFHLEMERTNTESLHLVDLYGVSVNWRFDGKRRNWLFFPTATPDAIRRYSFNGDLPTGQSVIPIFVMIPIVQTDYVTLPLLGNEAMADSATIGETQRKIICDRLSELGIQYACALFTDGSVRFIPVSEL